MANEKLSPKDIDVLVGDSFSSAQAFADYARELLNETQTNNAAALGFVPPVQTFVDGREGAALESVKLPGTIVFLFDVQIDLLTWIYDQLMQHAPELTGKYKHSITIYADGAAVDSVGAVDPLTSAVTFAATVAYARKIEGNIAGGGSRPPQSKQAPEGVFELVSRLAQARYGNLATIKFSYQAPMGGTGIEDWAHANGRRRALRAKEISNNMRVPAIIVRLK